MGSRGLEWGRGRALGHCPCKGSGCARKLLLGSSASFSWERAGPSNTHSDGIPHWRANVRLARCDGNAVAASHLQWHWRSVLCRPLHLHYLHRWRIQSCRPEQPVGVRTGSCYLVPCTAPMILLTSSGSPKGRVSAQLRVQSGPVSARSTHHYDRCCC